MKEKKEFGFKIIFKGFLNAFNVERGIIPTLRDLLLKPSAVITYCIEGNKGKYFSPGRFFVTIIAILSIVTFFTGGFDYEFLQQFYSDAFPDRMKDNKKGMELMEKYLFSIAFIQNNPLFRFPLLIIPSAFSSWLIFYSYRFNLAKHFVIHIYCWCFIALLIGLSSLLIDSRSYFEYGFSKGFNVFGSSITIREIESNWKYDLYDIFMYCFPFVYYIFAFHQP